ATQHWAGKALSPSNERWLKRALGAALKRDRSKLHRATLAQTMAVVARNAILIIALVCLTAAVTHTATNMVDVSDLPKGH
ncbi:putative membrane protein, partial [Sulfitobacter undariae]